MEPAHIWCNISQSDQALILRVRQDLREYLVPELDRNPYNYLRFLQGFDRDYAAVRESLKYYLRVYKAMEGNCCSDQRVRPMTLELAKLWPMGLLGACRKPDNNQVAAIECLGSVDLGNFYSVANHVDHMHFFWTSTLRLQQRAVEAEEQRTGVQSGICMVMDLEHMQPIYRVLHVTKTQAVNVMNFMSNVSVEFLTHVLVINQPLSFTIIWNFLVKILPKRTTEKIQLLGSNWKTELLDYVHPDVLPVAYGGNKPDNSPPIYDDIPHSCIIFRPCDNNSQNQEPIPIPSNPNPPCQISIPSDSIELKIKAGQKSYLSFYIAAEDSRRSTSRSTKSMIEIWLISSGELGFGGYFMPGERQQQQQQQQHGGQIDEAATDISCTMAATIEKHGQMFYPHFLRMNRVTLAAPIHETVRCSLGPGHYVFLLDNSHSWFTSLTVTHRFRVIDE